MKTSRNKKIIESIQREKSSFTRSKSCKEYFKLFNAATKNELFIRNFENVIDFTKSINNKHPDLQGYLEKFLNFEILQKINDFYKLEKYINKNNFNFSNNIDSFFDCIFSGVNKKEIYRIVDPSKNKISTRFLPYEKRWQARESKRIQNIKKENSNGLNTFFEKDIWMFSHNSNYVEEFYKELKEKHNNFIQINCFKMAKEIELYMSKVEDNINLKKNGFYRVSISKIISTIQDDRNIGNVIVSPVYLKCLKKDLKEFVDICDNFFAKDCPVFDHYAILKFDDTFPQYLIGEIDSKSYFIGEIDE